MLLFVLLGLSWVAAPKGNSTPASIVTSVDGHSYDFGSISMARGKVTTEFLITSPTSSPLKITKVYTSCMCTEATLSVGGRKFGPFGMPGHGIVPSVDTEIPAGQSAQLLVTFDPAAHGPAGVGKIERAVRVETNGEPLEYQISAFVTP